MFKLTLKCRTITPMFMYGADKNTPELRASEFKGMMRWWWRAVKAENDIEKLRREEAEIFGGTNKEARKSNVILFISDLSINTVSANPVPHKEVRLTAINGCFNVNIERDEKIKDIIDATLFITFTLGGFGRRARRGFGSVYVEEFHSGFKYKKSVLDKILEKLNKIKTGYDYDNSKNYIINTNSSGGLYPWIKEIKISDKSYDTSDEILRLIGQKSHDHRDNSLGNFNPRMASPIYVSVIEIDKKFYPIVTKLNSVFPQSYPNYNLSKQDNFINSILGVQNERF